MSDQTGVDLDVEVEGPTEEELDEAYALDALIDEDRSEEEQERRVNETAARVREENAAAEEAEAQRFAAIQEAVLVEGQEPIPEAASGAESDEE